MRRGAKILFYHVVCVLVAYTKESRLEWLDSGDNLTPSRGFVSSKFLEMLDIKFKWHGSYFNSLVGIMFFFYLWVIFTNLTWKEHSYQYIVASVSYTGSLGPSSRDIRGRVSPLGQPHLPVCQLNGV